MRKHPSFRARGRPASATLVTADPSWKSAPPGSLPGRTARPARAPGTLARPQRLHEIFETRADLCPGALAVVSAGERLTYLELEERANRLARHLRARGVGRGSRAAVLLPRSPDAYAALLGILKAGAAYVPLDPEYPVDRVAFILRDCEAEVLVTTASLASQHPRFGGALVSLDADAAAIAAESHARGPGLRTTRRCLKPMRLAWPGALLLLGLLWAPARAEWQEVEAAWEGDAAQGYSFASVTAPIWLDRCRALVVTLGGDHLYYGFPEADGRTLVRSTGSEATLGYRFQTERFTLTIASGYEFRQGSERQAEESPVRLAEQGKTAEADLYLEPTPLTTLTMAASYSDANRYTWGRAAATRQITRRRQGVVAIGPEGTVERGPDELDYLAGGVVAIELPGDAGSLELRAGRAWSLYSDESRDSRPYWGLGFSREFGDRPGSKPRDTHPKPSHRAQPRSTRRPGEIVPGPARGSRST